MDIPLTLTIENTGSGSYEATGAMAVPTLEPDATGSFGITPLMTAGDLVVAGGLIMLVILNIWAIIRRHA